MSQSEERKKLELEVANMAEEFVSEFGLDSQSDEFEDHVDNIWVEHVFPGVEDLLSKLELDSAEYQALADQLRAHFAKACSEKSG